MRIPTMAIVVVLAFGSLGGAWAQDRGARFSRRASTAIASSASSIGRRRSRQSSACWAISCAPRWARTPGCSCSQFGNLHGEGQFVFVRGDARFATVTTPVSVPTKPRVTEEVRVGSLALTSKLPGVEIWVADQKMGETRPGRSLITTDLAEGRHRIVAKKPGYRDWEQDVEVEASNRAELLVDLERLASPPSRPHWCLPPHRWTGEWCKSE